ncbi:Bcr/CflA family efflux MFS transporter [Raoultibacter massiliensis]|uniref:Bcr/CflA family efflux MFS transporter n=1 Tax=Raoultibacter massiliensis TaxID=1852371 RepID=A0ABV1JGT7_9ACTN
MSNARLASWLAVPQKRLKVGGLLALLAVSSFMTPLSLDMYTPAVPYMTEYFSSDSATVNFTLSGFFFCFTIGMLLFGPASDCYGRKPVLVASYLFYTVGSVACAVAPTIEVLVAARLVQGLGAGGATATGTAIVKDAFVSEHRRSILSIMQVLFVIGPVVAPLLGAGIIGAFDWRASFWVLAVVGACSIAASCCMDETICDSERMAGRLIRSYGRLGTVLHNRGFTVFLVITSFIDLGFMAYVASASYIYIDMFGLSEMGYSVYFSVAALVTIAGPFVYSAVSKRIGSKRYTTAALAAAFLGGALMLAFGHASPVAFCLTSLVVPLVQASVRPYSTNILLDQQRGDTGSASALINFLHGAIGSVGMVLVILPWPDFVTALGSVTAVFAAVGLVAWLGFLKTRTALAGIKGDEPAQW